MSSDSGDSDYKLRKSKSSKKKGKSVGKNSKKNKFICDMCGFVSISKLGLVRHIYNCTKAPKVKRKGLPDSMLRCRWCDVQFKNRGNLTTHALHVHGDNSYKVQFLQSNLGGEQFKCPTCDQTFSQNFQLTYHIRRMHYNMVSKIPYAMIKKVNQVWFERVQNSNIIMEIKKTGRNKLLMKKLDENTSIKVNNDYNNVIDVSDMYPTGNTNRKIRDKCPICGKLLNRRDIRKHISERHQKNIKHRCNNCKRGFKRLYLFLKHHCGRTRLAGVSMKDNETNIRITSVESLSIPM